MATSRYFALGKLQAPGSSVQKRPVSCRPMYPQGCATGQKLLGINRTLQCLFSANICRMPTYAPRSWLRASPCCWHVQFVNLSSGLHLLEAAKEFSALGAQASTCPEESAESPDSLRHPRIKIEAAPLNDPRDWGRISKPKQDPR